MDTKFLLDSNVLVNALYNPSRLSDRITGILLDDDKVKFLSVASIWELTIKKSIGKFPFQLNWRKIFLDQPLNQLSIELEHLETLAKLPMIHRDPFDRLLIAQCKVERMPLLTSDDIIKQYDVKVIG